MNKLLVLFLIFSQSSLADQVVLLEKNSPAPFRGYLFDEPQAHKVRLLKLDNEALTKENSYLKQDNELYIKRLENFREYNDRIANENLSLRENGIWTKLGFFILGAALTVGITYGVSRVTR